MMNSHYQLSNDVFFCFSGGRMVFLELRRDKYTCLSHQNTQTALGLFDGVTKPSVEAIGADHVINMDSSEQILRALTDAGIVACNGPDGRNAARFDLAVPEDSVRRMESNVADASRLSYYPLVFLASLRASWKLRRNSMYETVQNIRNLKERHATQHTTDNDSLRKLVGIFHHLRPYYVRKYRCLFDSLALIEFLARYEHTPQWVFGVKTEPFGAHCWVQNGSCVLNDSVANVRCYTPIMAI